jgi:hypothetical protein
MFGNNAGGSCLGWDYRIGRCLDDYLLTTISYGHHGLVVGEFLFFD